MKKLLLFLLCLPIVVFAGGPWVKGKGKHYSQIGITSKSYSGRYIGTYVATSHIELNRRVVLNQAWLYSEIGIGGEMDVIVNLPFSYSYTSIDPSLSKDTSFSNPLPPSELTAFDNISISLKRNFIEKKWLISGQLNVLANTSSRINDSGIQTGYNAWGITPTILFGKGKEKSFISGEVGLRYLTNKYASSSVFNFSYGGKLSKTTWLIGEVSGLVSFENGTHYDGNFEQTALYVDNQGFVAYGIKIAQNITENFALNLAAYSGFAVVNQGDNAGQLFLGISYKVD